jgi:hypothetical protein
MAARDNARSLVEFHALGTALGGMEDARDERVNRLEI